MFELGTDGVPTLLRSRSGLATLVKKKSRDTFMMHCIIHHQALASKTMPEDFLNVMKLIIKMVNFVKGSAQCKTHTFFQNYAQN